MKCQYCGSTMNEGDIYCSNCGNNLTIGNNYNYQNQYQYPNTNQNNLGQGGYNYPPIIQKKSPVAIILVVICGMFFTFIIGSIVLSVYIFNNFETTNYEPDDYYVDEDENEDVDIYSLVDNVTGTWNCTGSSSSTEYIVTLKLNKDLTFIWNKYNDEENNHVYGEFELDDLHKTNNSGEYAYYSIKLNGNEFVKDNILQNETYKSELEMGVNILDKSTAVIMNAYTIDIYYCKIDN
jgi:Transcription initiation factor TFIIIB, Brf1 subunit/Transcription initiation factor TFIIB